MVAYQTRRSRGILALAVFLLFVPGESFAQKRLVKILVSSPYIKEEAYQPIADVVAGIIIRDLKRFGGLEIIVREDSEEYIRKQGGVGWVSNRYQALDVGEAVGADIVIYSALHKNYETFSYNIAFLEVGKDVIQRVYNGSFRASDSASEIARIVKKDVDKLKKYIPLPSELADPGFMIREETINPDNLPKDHTIEDFPPYTRYGVVEQVLSYYRVFPGEMEYQKFERGTTVMRLSFRQEMDEDLTNRHNLFYAYGDFAIRHNMQAYFIKDCSTQAANVLLANNVPIFYGDDLLLGYTNLLSDGYCLFHQMSGMVFDSMEMPHRARMIMLIILPKPGRKGGISHEYLESAIALYKDEWDKTPKLVEIKEGMLDLIGSSLD